MGDNRKFQISLRSPNSPITSRDTALGILSVSDSERSEKNCVALDVFLPGKHEFITNFLPLPEFRIYFLKDFSSWELKQKKKKRLGCEPPLSCTQDSVVLSAMCLELYF